MGRTYSHVSLEDRCEISRLRGCGFSIRQIASALDRAPSTISRELKRNSGRQVGYKPSYAQEQARARRWSGSRLERNADLRRSVLDRLKLGWSPEQICGRLAREAGKPVVSHETIYRFVHAQITRTNNTAWRHLLPRGKTRRGFRGRKGGSPASFIEGRIPVAQRPAEVDDRTVPGHWEADFMLFARYGQGILTLHERSSRILLATRPPNRKAAAVARRIRRMLEILPGPMRQTVTFDNGTEFARHKTLHALSVRTYFCDPHAPWQKGGIENAIGRLRRILPRKTDLATVSESRFNQLLRAYNSTPRKCLDYQTPGEVFIANMLHFECESTSRPSTG